jgi:CO/xanthine dehydrogenase Mo-binding subunit
VWGSLQCPFYVHRSLLAVFALREDKVRVIQTETGGAFGGKEDFPSILASHAALLALKSGHVVKMVFDRMEDLAATPKRHPSRIRHRTAVDEDGMGARIPPCLLPYFRGQRCTPADLTSARM